MQDVSLNLAPLQLYIEDTYIFKLKDDFTKLLPFGLIEGGCTPSGEDPSPAHEMTVPTPKSSPKQKEVVSDVKPTRCDQSKPDEGKTQLILKLGLKSLTSSIGCY